MAFNSAYHRQEFLRAAGELVAGLPNARPPGLAEAIAAKAVVMPVPLDTASALGISREPRDGPLRILLESSLVPGQRDPEAFFRTLFMLAEQGREFQVAVLRPRSGKWPPAFDLAPSMLGTRLKQLGPVDDRAAYWRWLFWADVAPSTARQEYQGLSVVEAV